MGVPLLNTIILLTSGIRVTWSHKAVELNLHGQGVTSLFLTIILGIYFTGLMYAVLYVYSTVCIRCCMYTVLYVYSAVCIQYYMYTVLYVYSTIHLCTNSTKSVLQSGHQTKYRTLQIFTLNQMCVSKLNWFKNKIVTKTVNIHHIV